MFFLLKFINELFTTKLRVKMILIADIVLFFHFCIAVFITFGFVLIPIGYNFNWIWIKNKKLRLLHFGMMIFVTFETILGLSCPLTVLENNLRGINENQLFLSRWITEVIYWDFPSEFFLILYCLCLGWTFLIWKKYPPIE
jgi:hypothetical protein